ncbi:hypothetical protein C1J03_23060 [Sulfitobacter sp. SK012]|uniref:glutathione S-transferase family protein n=1 Tax=Sulfitobacter sp. SK012 TaxID=1389005 RepID=UPI000E0B7B93|nr:glutathione S-transferase family protein [Sulfitobacter sp. SK012]AXI48624.1 hypothetical protein C1J03_23060 [Sulfitobacter sp. SK012]
MITLLTYAPAFGQSSPSPFCLKAEWLLNLSSQQWQREDLKDPRKMPHAKLPAIKVDDRIIPDSDNIRVYLEEHGAQFDKGMSDMDKATARAFIRMAEEHMYFHLVMDRWGNDAVWPMVRDTYFDMIPKIVRGVITNRIRKAALQGLHGQGTGRLSEEERMARIEPDFAAISARLWQGAYLFEDAPTAADASVGAVLASIRAAPADTALSRRVSQDQQLSAYADRCIAALG